MTKGRKALGAAESTIETTKNCDPASPLGGRGQAQPGQVSQVHRSKAVLRRERGAEAPLQEGWRVQALVRPPHEGSQPRPNSRRRSYGDRIANMKPRPTQFGVRENTASSRQHASRLAVSPWPLESERLALDKHEDRQSSEQVSPTIETFNLSLTEPEKGATGGGKEGTSNLATESHRHGEQSAIERPLTCEEAAELVRVHPKTVKRMARTGELPGHFRFGRWFFYASELDCWMRTELHSSRHSCR